MIVDIDWTYTYWSSGIENIACLQGEELTYIAYKTVNREYHVSSIAFLNAIAVDVESEAQVLDVKEVILRNPFSIRRSLCIFPKADLPRVVSSEGLGR